MNDRFGGGGNRLVVDQTKTALNVPRDDLTLIKAGEYLEVRTKDMPEYDGPTEFTPSLVEQVIQTAERAVMTDIVIAPIPSNYGRIEQRGTALRVY